MGVTIILFICMYMSFPILFIAMWFEGQPKEEMLFGVKMKKAYMEEERVKKIRHSYRKEMKFSAIVLGIEPFSVFFIKYFSIVYTILIYWLLIMIVVSMVPFMKANSKIMRLKRENGWGPDEKQVTYVDTEAAKVQEKVIGKAWFIIACIISLLPVAVYIIKLVNGKTELLPLVTVIMTAAATVLFAGIGIVVQQNKGYVVSNDSLVNATISRIKKYQWAKAMAVISMLNAFFTIYLAAMLSHVFENSMVFIVVSILYSVVVCVVLFKAEFTVCNQERKLCEDHEKLESVDDDENWICGTFYYNKNDTSCFVDKRVGSGWTVNMAKRSMQIVMGIVVILILLLPLSSVFMIADEFVPIKCQVENESVMISQYKGEYQIPLNEVKKVELLYERPNLSKTNGTALDTVLKGSFYSREYGAVKVCMRPENKYFLVVTTEQKTYIVNDEKDSDTLAVYNQISK